MTRLQKVLLALVVIAAIVAMDIGGIRSDFMDGWRGGWAASRPAADSTR